MTPHADHVKKESIIPEKLKTEHAAGHRVLLALLMKGGTRVQDSLELAVIT